MIENYLINILSLLIICFTLSACTKNNSENKPANSNDVLIGDLGGMPVNLPSNITHLVEYNGDPSWGEKRNNPIPQRTYQSKINSFGFDLRYTDGRLLDNKNLELLKQYDKERLKTDNPWISIGVMSGDRYNGVGAIHRIVDGAIYPKSNNLLPIYIYSKLTDKQYMLEVYAPAGIDPKTNHPWRYNKDAEDIFIQRNNEGKVVTFIKCTNRTNIPRPPCTHYFDLEPEIGGYVYASYSRWNLEKWQIIQSEIKKAIFQFKRD